ncbi:putative regulator PrlF [Peptococcaceae bacterium CEB3]|nr:putative regulator PrlF [Peptococcaceae bacterium CEB3]
MGVMEMSRMNAPGYENWATVTEKGQVTIPKAIRDELGIPHGGKIRFRRRYDGIIVVETPSTANQITGRLQTYASPGNPVDAYTAREKMEHDRTKELGY